MSATTVFEEDGEAAPADAAEDVDLDPTVRRNPASGLGPKPLVLEHGIVRAWRGMSHRRPIRPSAHEADAAAVAVVVHGPNGVGGVCPSTRGRPQPAFRLVARRGGIETLEQLEVDDAVELHSVRDSREDLARCAADAGQARLR